MKRFYLITAVLMVVVGAMGAVAMAAPTVDPANNQPWQTFPTATLLAVEDAVYTIEEVRATDDPQVFPDQTVDGFSYSNITYVSRYPRGLEFVLNVTAPEGETLQTVTMLYEFSGGSRGRVEMTPTENDDEWLGVAYDTGGLPPWQVMNINFRAITVEGNSAESEPFMVEYYDASRPWFRAESEFAIVYWFEFPVELGDYVMQGVAAVQDKYEKGFGGKLSYVPRVIIFPPGDAIGEYQAGGQGNPRTTGSASSETQSAVLRVRGLDIEDIRQECIWNEPRDLDWQMRFAASVTTHEIAHLYQYEFFNGNGPAWWIEGQATFFELDSGPFDARMQNLALTEDLPSLQGSGPSGMVGTPASDGCTHLGYEMGTSFINWFVNTYGGYDTHREVVELMDRNVLLADALEQVSGVPFVELEKQWRVYVGLNPEPRLISTPTFPSIPTRAPFYTPTPSGN